ncbi:ribose-phosphate pyrophosphokinase [Candidatus Roizmanbacteria bacterium]|nr:ribose-phosphate pyrophosphokinase [Candidatus Roizmanbacteria bacterium]
MFKLFSGTSNVALTSRVSHLLLTPIADSEVVRFENSEIRVHINGDVKNSVCVLIQSTSNPTDTHLMELFFFCDALRRQEAKKVIGIIPYFGYARQDVQHRPGECVSVNVIIKFLESIGFYKIYTVNLHDEATEGVFSIPFKNIDAFPILAREIKKYIKDVTVSKVAVVSPDHGGVERARKFSDELFGHQNHTIAVVEKRRDLEHIHQSVALDLYGDVKGKVAILVDDMITSGGTLIHAAQLCLDRGATKVLAAVVHHDFAPNAPKKLQSSLIERFFTTDSIALKSTQKFKKLHEVTIAPLIAEEFKNFV